MVHEAMLQLGLDLILVDAGSAELHGTHMGLTGNIGGGLHDFQLTRTLVQSHVVQQMVQRQKLLRRLGTETRLAANQVDPVGQPTVKVGIGAHGVVDTLPPFNQPRQDVVDIIDRERIIGTVFDNSAFLPSAIAIPQLAFLVAFAAEQHVLAVLTPGHQHGHRLRFGKTGQVLKITVLAIIVFNITITDKDLRRRQNGDAVGFHLTHQRLAAARIFGLGDSHAYLFNAEQRGAYPVSGRRSGTR